MSLRALSAAVLACSLVIPVAVRAADFVVLDQKASEELDETTRLYVDGALVATVRLDQATTEMRVPVSVPDGSRPANRSHDYALCGEIAFRNRDGNREVHQVSGQGVLVDPAGRTFLALGARDFTEFYLADPTDPAAVQTRYGRSPFCQTPVS